MDGFEKVAQLDDLAPGRSKKVTVNGRAIALFNVKGKLYAIHNSCPHEGGPLADGRLKGYVVACPWHDPAVAAPARSSVFDRHAIRNPSACRADPAQGFTNASQSVKLCAK